MENNLLPAIWLWVKAVWVWWWVMAGGGMVTTATHIISRVSDRWPTTASVLKAISPWALIFSMLIACFLARNDASTKSFDLSRQLDSIQNVEFRLSINGMNIYRHNDNNTTGIFLSASVENTGAPSIAKHYTLMLNIDGVGKREALLLKLDPGKEQHLTNTDGSKTIMYGTNSLPHKTENAMVIGVTNGDVWFILRNMKKSLVIHPSTELTLSVQDKTGKTFSTTKTIHQINDF